MTWDPWDPWVTVTLAALMFALGLLIGRFFAPASDAEAICNALCTPASGYVSDKTCFCLTPPKTSI